MAPPKLCFNRECSDPASEPLRKGWPLRAGNFAELCHRCASAYEDGRFCEIFHINHNGWRDCESCRKSMHCGCIVSVQDFILLDSGGVKCMACATEKPNTVTNQISPPPAKRPVPEFKDISVRNWNGFAAPSVVSGQLWQSPNSNMATLAPPKSELHAWMSREHRSSDPDKLTPGGSDRMEKRPSLESSVKASVGRMLFSLHDSCLNASVLPSTANEDQSIQHFNMPQSYRPPSEMNAGVSGTQPYRQMPQPPLSKQLHANSQIGVESSNETQNRNGKPRGDARGRNQLPLPRYWPKITDQELQQISGDSNAVITPLFEKILSASDAGRIGRLVLPKKCAEAYLPSISQPEGIPLEVQDLKGNKWTFQFRFWPNNNSRMYVLEGVTPCIQSMQLQAGDTVTFSRLDPEGKLVMGFRKVSYVPPSDQDNQRLKAGASVSTNSEVDLTNPANTWPKVKKSGCIAKEGFAGEPSLIPGKRKNSSLGSRSKRLQVGNDDIIELQIKWEDIFGLLRPPPNHVHGIVVIEGHEIEEFEEPPIVGKPTIFAEDSFGVNIQWVQCEDCTKWRKVPIDALLASRWTCSDNLWDKKRSSCSSDEELTATGLHELLNSNNTEKMKTVKKDAEAVDGSEGLDTLANLAILGEGGVLPSSVQPSTTKHPRHKPGCSCIVCIQPPSGQFPKHSDTCLCNACLIVKRRFRTLTERRGKRQLENETETRQQKQLVVEPQMSSSAMNKNNGLNHKSLVCGVADDTTIVKGGIDLNIQPERDDDQFQPSASGSMMRLVRDGNDKFHEQLESADSSRQFVERVEPSIDGSGGNKLKSSVFHGY